MVLTLGDLELLKQLRGAGGLGRNVSELNIRLTLDRLVKGGYLGGRPIDRRSAQYRITQRGQDAIVEHDFGPCPPGRELLKRTSTFCPTISPTACFTLLPTATRSLDWL
jgi:hypothetical protein